MSLFGNLLGRHQAQMANWGGSGNAPYMVGQPADYGMGGQAPDGFSGVQAPPQSPNQGPGVGRMIAGSIGDALLRMSGGQPIFAPAMQMQLQQRMEEARQNREHDRSTQDSRNNFLFEQEYRQSHPAPREPLHWRANNGDFMEVGEDGQPRQLYRDPTPRINWIQVRDPATGALNIIPMGPNGPMNGANATPPAQGGDDEWDYGDGGASPSNGSGGFPRQDGGAFDFRTRP